MDKSVLSALIALSPSSMTKIARSAEIDHSNLSTWLRDLRVLSEDAQQRLADVLGLAGEELATDRVFFWKTDRDFDSLQLVLDNLVNNAKLIPLVKQRGKRYDFADLFAQPMAALVSDVGLRAVLFLKTPIVKDIKYAGELPWFSPKFLVGTSWLRDLDDKSFPEPIQLDKALYQRWKNGTITVDEFNALLSETNAVAWSTVIDKALSLNLTPEQVLLLLDR